MTHSLSVCECVCVCVSLVQQGDGGASLALLDHVGLVPQRDAERGWSQSTRLAIHLHTQGIMGADQGVGGHLRDDLAFIQWGPGEKSKREYIFSCRPFQHQFSPAQVRS